MCLSHSLDVRCCLVSGRHIRVEVATRDRVKKKRRSSRVTVNALECLWRWNTPPYKSNPPSPVGRLQLHLRTFAPSTHKHFHPGRCNVLIEWRLALSKHTSACKALAWRLVHRAVGIRLHPIRCKKSARYASCSNGGMQMKILRSRMLERRGVLLAELPVVVRQL
jgi:hypothetical protein